MAEVKHPRMAEAIANAEKAAVSTRGLYPLTKASHVIKEDGTPLETETEAVEETTKPEDGTDTPTST